MDITGEDEWSDWEDDDMPARSLLEDKMLASAKVKGPTVHTCKTGVRATHGTVSFGGSVIKTFF